MNSHDFQSERQDMVQKQVVARGITTTRVLDAMATVPRHHFVRAADLADAYADHPLPIGFGQTISQPYIVALMTDLAEISPNDTVLEIGTGSGYQAAVLSQLCHQVYTVETIPILATQAKQRFEMLGLNNINVICGNGFHGYPNHAPYQAIVVTAAPETIPPNLPQQLALQGRLVIPAGPKDGVQDLLLIHHEKEDWYTRRRIIPVRFVPLVE